MEIKDIEAFIIVTKLGSITAAADKLHLTQPAVSRRIQRLEEELKCLIFERIGTKLILTPAGKVFYNRCRRILVELKEAIKDTQAIHALPNSFSVGIVRELSNSFYIDKFIEFCRLHTITEFHLTTSSGEDVLEEVSCGNIDLGFGFEYFPNEQTKGLEQVVIGHQKIVIISASNTNLLPTTPDIRHLNKVDWVTFPKEGTLGTLSRKTLESLLLIKNITPGKFIEVGDTTALLKFIEADFGLGFIPFSAIEEYIKKGSIQIVQIPEFQATIPMIAVYRITSAKMDVIENFSNFISEY